MLYKNERGQFLDPNFEAVIDKTAKQLGFNRTQVSSVIRHFFNWNRRSFGKKEYSHYYWPRFGRFQLFVKSKNKHKDHVDGIDVKQLKHFENMNKVKDARPDEVNITAEDIERNQDLVPKVMRHHPSIIKQIKRNHPLYSEFKTYGWYVEASGEGDWNKLMLLKGLHVDEFLKHISSIEKRENNKSED